MGGTFFADERGEFDLVVTDGRGTDLARIVLEDLDPEQELYTELQRGGWR